MPFLLLLLTATAGCHDGTAQKSATPPAGYAFPALTGRVVDQADLLPPTEEAALVSRSEALERTTGHQFVIVTLDSLGGHTIDDYSLKLGNYWGIGRKAVNDGVLLVVAPNERKVRIEVGRGLETIVTNAEAARIIDADILPRFRRGEMASGIERGSDDLIADLSKEAT